MKHDSPKLGRVTKPPIESWINPFVQDLQRSFQPIVINRVMVALEAPQDCCSRPSLLLSSSGRLLTIQLQSSKGC